MQKKGTDLISAFLFNLNRLQSLFLHQLFIH